MAGNDEGSSESRSKVQSLQALDKNIDRKKLTLAEQTRRAEKLVKSQGITMSAAMAKVARAHLRSQRDKPESRASGKRGSFTPSGPPKRDPFGSGTRKPTGEGVTRRGGRQPKK
jgi:hypothetical protein